MKMKSCKSLVLVLIYANTGKWSWYQIERALNRRGLAGKTDSTQIIKMLVSEGLVEEQQDPKTNISTCSITEQGRKVVQSLIEEYGPETFTAAEQNPNDYE